MWWTHAIQSILEFVSNNSDILAGVALSAVGWRVGLFGWLAKKSLEKIIQVLAKRGINEVDKIEDGKASEVVKETSPFDKTKESELDKAEREILEGK